LKQFLDIKKNIKCKIVEACDGIECITALYIADSKQIKITAIISDETMTYISGSYCSKIIEIISTNGKFSKIPMFIATSISHTTNIDNYSKVVQKIYSKPLDKSSVIDLIKLCDFE